MQLRLEGNHAQILVRLHSGRTFYSEPELPPKRPVGRPSRHGKKLDCKDPNTWPRPTGELFSETNHNSVAILLTYGTARVLLAPATPRRGRKSVCGEWPLHEALNGHQRSKTTHTLSQSSVPY